MGEKSKFQKELERMAARQIALMILIGCTFFCVAIAGISMLNQRIRKARHLDAVEQTVQDIYRSSEDFLLEEENQKIFAEILKREKQSDKGKLRYLLSTYNISAPVGANLLMADPEGRVIFSSFSGEELNPHRKEFHKVASENAVRKKEKIYSTVYYFSGDTSEYVLIHPLYKGRVYLGSVAAYLKGKDWNRHFLKYQYDAIVTDPDGDIIFCSNPSFLSGGAGNKYHHKTKALDYLWVGDSCYLTGERYLQEPGMALYSFIYTPRNITYFLMGILVILGLGLTWAGLFRHYMDAMLTKTTKSVELLVNEIRVIRKKDPNHVIKLETGDEIEEIAEQINKMMNSIRELNQRNLDLMEVNNQMEVQNLQAQLNPHFIYNTLDNIRYLIVQDAVKADELIGHFTRILRYSINNTKQKVPLREDMEYIQRYLVIQKTRFGSRFQYEMEIDPACEQIYIPKLLLQPLIENSLKYGFKKKPKIFVKIQGWMEEGYLMLRVEDDGPGEPKPTMELLKEILQRRELNTAHNGLQNIHRRISLEYGHDSGLSIESEEGSCFIVTLKLWAGGEKNVSGASC